MPRAVPLYLDIARQIRDGIGSGHYPVGSLLPPEPELAASFGVSRQTLRQAILHLRGQKLLSARKGIGTRVESSQPRSAYYQALQELTDVFQYAHETILRVTASRRIIARGRQAAELNCRSGHEWLHLKGVREVLPEADAPDQGQRPPPLCLVEVWVDGRYGAVAEGETEHRGAIFSKIEARFGATVVEAVQELEATLLDAESARLLDARTGGPALSIRRRYIEPGGEVMLISHSLYPAERFRYTMRIRRDG